MDGFAEPLNRDTICKIEHVDAGTAQSFGPFFKKQCMRLKLSTRSVWLLTCLLQLINRICHVSVLHKHRIPRLAHAR